MTPLRGKAIALWSAGVAVVALGAAGFAFSGHLIEQWCLWRLESEDPAVRTIAAERLGKMRSLRGISEAVRKIQGH